MFGSWRSPNRRVDFLVDDLLIAGLDDWVPAAEVVWIAKSRGNATTDHAIRVLAIRMVRAAIFSGLTQAGDVTKNGFVAWDLPPKDAVRRIEKDWKQLGRIPDLGDVCWFANTKAGDQRAREIADHR